MNLSTCQEDLMLDQYFIQFIVKDILYSGEYTLEGIARYTDIHEDVILDFASGLNTEPLASSLRKIMELHKSVRAALYQVIGKKLLAHLDKSINSEESRDTVSSSPQVSSMTIKKCS